MIADFLANVFRWCDQRSDVVGLALVGSYAHGTATENSDLDLVVISKTAHLLLTDHSWVLQFGNAREVIKENYGKVTSLRTKYEGFIEVEFGITNLTWVDLPLDQGTKKVFLDGIKILYDPDNLLREAVDSTR